jgi:3-dehydroquinate dehydratase
LNDELNELKGKITKKKPEYADVIEERADLFEITGVKDFKNKLEILLKL